MLDSRKTYNLVMDCLLKKGFHSFEKCNITNELEMEMSNKFITQDALKQTKHFYLLRTPKAIRQQAMKKALAVFKAFKTNYSKRLYLRNKYPNARAFKKNIKFNPQFKSKKNIKSDAIDFEKTAIKYLSATSFSFYCQTNVVFSRNIQHTLLEQHNPHSPRLTQKPTKQYLFSTMHIQANNTKDDDGDLLHPNMFNCDAKIAFHLGRFYFLPSIKTPVDDKHEWKCSKNKDVCASIDPGIRKFLTIYSPEGKAEILGLNTNKILDKCIRRIDRTKQQLKKTTKNYLEDEKKMTTKKQRIHTHSQAVRVSKKYVYTHPITQAKTIITGRQIKKKIRNKIWKRKQQYHKAELKAQNKIKDLHYKAAHYLAQNYKIIHYPLFNAHEIASGKLKKCVKRRLNMLSFYKFKQRLIQTCTWYSGVRINCSSEAYTSKQCGHCGFLNDNLNGKETFECKNCLAVADRDVHGAFNHFLRDLNDSGSIYEVKQNEPDLVLFSNRNMI